MNESKIQRILTRYLLRTKNHKIVVPNITNIFSWECDLISVTSADMVHEFEIKISRSDYLADGKKDKHLLMTRYKAHQKCANYFWYVVSFDLPLSDLRSHAGLISIAGGVVRILKPAPKLHAQKLTPIHFDKIARSLTYKLFNSYAAA